VLLRIKSGFILPESNKVIMEKLSSFLLIWRSPKHTLSSIDTENTLLWDSKGCMWQCIFQNLSGKSLQVSIR
jgi:hypothetical protein